MTVLQLSAQGNPSAWLSYTAAATLIVKGQVSWSLGNVATTLRGGVSRSGKRSLLDVPAIIATRGVCREKQFVPCLTNRTLFRRDGNQCLYCGQVFMKAHLTRDHIVPKVQGGEDHWMNVATACRRCNNVKGGRTPEQAGMSLIAVPFVPNRFEYFYLSGHKLYPEQTAYLKSQWTGHRSWEETEKVLTTG